MEGLAGFAPERDREIRVFLPALHRRAVRAAAEGRRFVHYTNLHAAMSVIRSGTLWLRNAQCMNDYSEVRHGLGLLDHAYRSAKGQELVGFLDGIFSGFRSEVAERIAALAETVSLDSFIGCVSEHDDLEDGVGRLSMWRAYSEISGVALVLSNAPLIGPGSEELAVFTGPVEYAGPAEFFERFGRFVDGVIAEGEFVAGLGRERACLALVGSYHFGALATKHPGFAEEREWRMAFTPRLQPTKDLLRTIEVCRNQPQVVYKLPLARREGEAGASTALADILDSLIVGPCESAHAVEEAFVELLTAAGVPDAAARVKVSRIPVR